MSFTPVTFLSEPLGTLGDMDTLRIDCTTCAVAGRGCHDCPVSLLLGPPDLPIAAPPDEADLDIAEQRALAMFEAAGMLAPDEQPAVVIRPHAGLAWHSA